MAGASPGVVAAVMVLACSSFLVGQTNTFTIPWGHPDLQGVWNNQTPVPLERPEELGNKTSFTKEEAAEYEKTHASRLFGFVSSVEPTEACPPGKEPQDIDEHARSSATTVACP